MTEMQEKAVKEWHNEGVAVAASYLRDEARLVELLCKMHENKGYLLYRAETLRQYAISLWNIPENAVYDLVTVAKKASEVPAMIDALRARKATVSKLRKVCPVIDFKNQKIWLDVVRHCSTREIEKCVAEAKPETDVKDSSIQKSSNLVQMKTGVSVSTRDALELLRELKSQRDRKAASMGDVLAELAEMGLRKFDPVQKAKRAMDREERRNSNASVSESATEAKDSVSYGSFSSTKATVSDTAAATATSLGTPNTDDTDTSNNTKPSKVNNTNVKVTTPAAKITNVSDNTDATQLVNASNTTSEAMAPKTTNKAKAVSKRNAENILESENMSKTSINTNGVSKSSLARDVRDSSDQSKNNRNRLPARLVHLINLRDGRQCTQINLMGVRCTEQRWLDFHHIREVALGGKDELDNLTTFCAAHHRLHHFHESWRSDSGDCATERGESRRSDN